MDERDYRLPELRFEFPGLNALVQGTSKNPLLERPNDAHLKSR
jgi:hypothetical protein